MRVWIYRAVRMVPGGPVPKHLCYSHPKAGTGAEQETAVLESCAVFYLSPLKVSLGFGM